MATFRKGQQYGENSVFIDLYNKTDKKQFFKALSVRVWEELNDPKCDPQRRDQLTGMWHGLRVAQLILGNYGDVIEAYQNIIKPDVEVSFTADDMKKA